MNIDQLDQIFNKFLALFNSPHQVVYWGYLLATLLIAAAVYFIRDRQPSESVLHVLSYCFPKRIYLNRSFMHDLSLFIINLLLFAFVLSYISITSDKIGPFVYSELLAHFGPMTQPLTGLKASAVYMFAVMVALDLGFFVSHYLHHKIPVLWEFHKVHHTAPVLNPLTAFRRHPVDLFIELNIIALLLGLVLGVFAFWSNDTLDMLTILGVNAGVFLFFMVGSHLQHSHIWLSYGPLNKLFVSPAMHHIHHSSDHKHQDKNMGGMFSFWDWIMRTRYIPREHETLQLGLANSKDKAMNSLLSLCFTPFVKLFSRKK